MKTYSVRDGQSLWDIAVEVYGDVEAVYWLLDDNRSQIQGITDRLYPGMLLTIRDVPKNTRVATYLKDFAPFQTIDEGDRPEGVGYWYLSEYVVQ
ncbi:LysM domain-containing protein [Fibrisoma montanum]|uniref:LysM domain-containing protein n=1 Tax=Fibrisoma montanum TaxID=2305895 RepID=A0A418M6D9_9BACT|nr:LysM domain-containing protein [Fibrisoma montanum]RIV21401.1 LysM domain-containing protein [Fibrisoma montanum]